MPDDPTATADPGVEADPTSDTGPQTSDTSTAGSPTPEVQGPTPTAAPPPQADQTPAATLTPAPNIVRPKRGGLAGVMDEIADDLAGPGSVHTDAQGNEYINRKGQWLKIAGEALRGAAAGAAVAKGPGGAFRGAEAGIEAQDKVQASEDQQAQQQRQNARQDKQDQFNAVMQKHNLAAKEFELQRMGVKANQDDIKFAQEQNDREEKLGSADLGIVKDEADLADQMSKQQGFWKDVHRNQINAVPEYGSDGTRLGLHVWKRIPGIGDQQTDPGTPIRIWDAGNKKMTTQVPTVPLTHNQVDAYNHAADNAQRQSQIDDNAEAYKKQQMDTSEAEEESHRATTRKTNAETRKLNADTAAEAPPNPALVEGIGKGTIAPESLNRMLGGKDGQKLLEAVAAAHPDLDTSKLSSYPKTYIDFTSGKTAQQRQNLDNAFKAVDDLTKLNTYAARLPAGAPRAAWDNRLNAASQEIANGLAKPGTSAREDDVKGVRTALSPVISRQAAIDKQIDSLMDAYGSMRTRWQEAAPSAVYEAKMPDVGAQTKAIMYAHNPGQAEQWFGQPAFASAPGKPRMMSYDGGKTWQPAPSPQ
jgi:hypothetical protein